MFLNMGFLISYYFSNFHLKIHSCPVLAPTSYIFKNRWMIFLSVKSKVLLIWDQQLVDSNLFIYSIKSPPRRLSRCTSVDFWYSLDRGICSGLCAAWLEQRKVLFRSTYEVQWPSTMNSLIHPFITTWLSVSLSFSLLPLIWLCNFLHSFTQHSIAIRLFLFIRILPPPTPPPTGHFFNSSIQKTMKLS